MHCDAAVADEAHPMTDMYDLTNNVPNLATYWQSKTMNAMYEQAGSPSLAINITFSFGHLYTLQVKVLVLVRCTCTDKDLHSYRFEQLFS